MNERVENIAAKIYEDAFVDKGIWLPCEFPPEAEGMYQRRIDGRPFLHPKRWDGSAWRGVTDDLAQPGYQIGEYLLPAGSWALTKGVRPPLAGDALILFRLVRGWECPEAGALTVGHITKVDCWPDIASIRLAPALKPKCQHEPDQWGFCFWCSKHVGHLSLTQTPGESATAISAKHEAERSGGRPVFIPYRDKRFGLLVKYAEPRSRTVPKECPVNALNEWRK